MAQSIPANAVVELTCVSRYQTQTILNVFHYYNSGASIALANGDSELLNLMEEHKAKVWSDPANGALLNVVDGFELDYLKVQVVNPARQYYIYTNVGEVGALAGEGIPSDTHLTTSFRVNLAGRGRTGNKKWTGLATAAIINNVFDPVYQSAFDLVCNQVRLTLPNLAAVATWVPIIWSPSSPTLRNLIIDGYSQEEVRVQPTRRFRKGI